MPKNSRAAAKTIKNNINTLFFDSKYIFLVKENKSHVPIYKKILSNRIPYLTLDKSRKTDFILPIK